MSKTQISIFDAHVIEAVARVLGDTGNGLTGPEIGFVLGQSGIDDVDGAQQTKWKRIYNALASRQNKDQAGNVVVRFITEAMAPVRYRTNPASCAWRTDNLNEVLVHAGYEVRPDGKIQRAKDGKATTLEEAQRRAGTIRTELERRQVHAEVLVFCTTEILQRNNFHAVLEAAKSVPDRLRLMSGLTSDGSDLVNATLSRKSRPMISINAAADDTDSSEQSGFANLVLGLLGMYRNTTAHAPKIRRPVSDSELLEAFTVISMVHRRLDIASIVRSTP